MLKVGPLVWTTFGLCEWDHKGKSEIAQIIVSRSLTRINFIYFVYVEDGGKKIVMSERIGSGEGGTMSLNLVRIKNLISTNHIITFF